MDQVYAWVDDRRERNSREFYRLLEQGRQVWTPNDIFKRCCVEWLVDGEDSGDDGYELYDAYSPRNGCDERRCNRDHPHITLRFDAATGTTIATISHRLDPFVRCLNNLDGAWPHNATVYHLNGYLRRNETALRSHDGFGGHLVKVEPGSREASDAAQAAELEKEESERESKRPRVNGDTRDTEPFNKLEEVMDILVKHRLQLDMQNEPVTLFCMRPVCKLFNKIATSIASKKVKTLDLSITPLVNGTGCYGYFSIDGYDEETFAVEKWGFDGGHSDIKQYSKKEDVSLLYQPPEEAGIEGGYYPVNTEAATFDWESGTLLRDLEEDEDEDHDSADWAEYAYHGQLMRVFWHPSQADPVHPPERRDFNGQAKPSLGVIIAEFNLRRRPDCGNVTKSQKGVTINYEVLESNASQTEEEEDAPEEENKDSDEEGNGAGSPLGQTRRYIEYSGKIKLNWVKVDFGILVRAHACEVKGELRRKYSNILKERPLTQTEKEYEKLVALAAGC
mmetsp:Transcript_39858/g.72938  ORF Transcript_39858/g.72938 Transcript_39858/m.72938 type:complete len:506 (-) Transcript_39858:76-1593(-)